MNPNPLVRDTVILPKKGWVAIRFFTDNPGVWYTLYHEFINLRLDVGTFIVIFSGM